MSMYDMLADYLGGALDGTPEGEAVAARIATDPEWRAAYEDLVAADIAVRADLTALRDEHPRMPPDVEARISAALSAERALAKEEALPGGGASPTEVVRPVIAPEDRRRSRWALAGGTLAVVLLASAGLGVLVNTTSGPPNSSTSAEDRAVPEALTPGVLHQAPSGQAPAPDADVLTLSSGRNYTRRELASGPRAAAAAPTDREEAAAPVELGRLREAGALGACLAQITRAHGTGVMSVDYARFEGQPALIVSLSGADAEIAVGPDCGLTDADLLYPTPR